RCGCPTPGWTCWPATPRPWPPASPAPVPRLRTRARRISRSDGAGGAMVGRLLGVNSFSARAPITVGDHRYEIFRLAALDDTFGIHRLPYSLKILLENLLRFEDGVTVTAADIEGLAAGDHGG